MNPAVYASLPASACTLGTEGGFGPDRITKNEYYDDGDLKKEIRAYGTPLAQDYATYTYSANGKRTSLTDARGYKASMTRSEEHTSELQSLMRISYAVFCLKKKKQTIQ